MKPDRIVNIALLISIIGMIATLAGAAWVCAFDADEFQHLETAWLIAKESVPYKDFFEHHTPLYHFLIAPLLNGPEILTNADVAIRTVLELRLISVVLDAGILALVYFIARRLAGRMEALFACLLLASSIIFIQKGVEIRPDQLATLLLLGSTLALLTAIDSKKWPWLCASAGLGTALAILTTQKILLATPGLALTILAVSIRHRMARQKIIASYFIFAIAAFVGSLPFLLYFWSHQALNNFVVNNFLLGAKWKHITSTIPWIFSLIGREDALLILLAAIGITECLRQKQNSLRYMMVLAPLFSMLLFIPLFPVVQRQYIFLFYPYVAILGGVGATFITRSIVARGQKIFQPALILPLVIVLHGISLLGHELSQRNTATLEKLRYVVEQTAPTDTVMSAWSPGITFREPAFFYPVLHEEIRPLIPQASYEKLLAGLKDGSISPAVIDMDRDMEQLPPDIVAIMKARWQPTAIGTLWRRITF